MPGSLNNGIDNQKIIEKYKIGRSLNSLLHVEDDLAFDPTSVYDYFGFYHEGGLTKREAEVEKKYRKKDAKRINKWVQMQKSPEYIEFTETGLAWEEFTRRVFKGIPPPIRTAVWSVLLHVKDAKRPDLYKRMLEYACSTSTDLHQIDLDINRTFRSTAFFSESFGPRQQTLFNILTAYSVYNSEVGYCQGMSDLAGMLLIYVVDEEDAFWAFAQLLNGPKHNMHSLFVRDFPGLERYFKHHDKMLRVLLPSLYKHFQKEGLDTCMYALKWYMQCFLGRLPISLTLRIWDIFLLEGEKILVAMSYNILKMHHKHLMKMDQTKLMCFLQNELTNDFCFDDDDVIDALKDRLEELRKARLETPPPLTEDMLPKKKMGFAPPVWQPQELVNNNEESQHHHHSKDEDGLHGSVRSSSSINARLLDGRRRVRHHRNGSAFGSTGTAPSDSESLRSFGRSPSSGKYKKRAPVSNSADGSTAITVSGCKEIAAQLPPSPPVVTPVIKSPHSSRKARLEVSSTDKLRKPKSTTDLLVASDEVWHKSGTLTFSTTGRKIKSRPPLPSLNPGNVGSHEVIGSQSSRDSNTEANQSGKSKSHKKRVDTAGIDGVDDIEAGSCRVSRLPLVKSSNSPVWLSRSDAMDREQWRTLKPVVYTNNVNDTSNVLRASQRSPILPYRWSAFQPSSSRSLSPQPALLLPSVLRMDTGVSSSVSLRSAPPRSAAAVAVRRPFSACPPSPTRPLYHCYYRTTSPRCGNLLLLPSMASQPSNRNSVQPASGFYSSAALSSPNPNLDVCQQSFSHCLNISSERSAF